MKHWLLFVALICFGSNARANHDSVVALDRGSYIQTSVITGSSFTGTAFANSNPFRMDGTYFNNTASAVWIGTNTATTQTNHENLRIGYPVLSSTTFKLDGKMPGAIYFTCDANTGPCQIRAVESFNYSNR